MVGGKNMPVLNIVLISCAPRKTIKFEPTVGKKLFKNTLAM
jgi:hypothetical protein